MRLLAFLSMVAIGLVIASATVVAQGCPSNANQASYSIWPENSIKTGVTKTGTHRCGRKLRCTGGAYNVRGSRSCSWL